jgi:hypothetical protein
MALISELGVREAADAIRTGGLTAETLADTLLARCAAAASLNAFITLAPDDVRAAARRADEHRRRGGRLGPLHGVPLALKDNIDTADFPTTAGTPGLARHRPARNAPVVQRLLDAGALVLGKANLQPPTTPRSVRRATPMIECASRAARAGEPGPRSPPGLRPPGSAPTRPVRYACPERCAASPHSVPARCAGRRPASCRSRTPATRRDR